MDPSDAEPLFERFSNLVEQSLEPRSETDRRFSRPLFVQAVELFLGGLDWSQKDLAVTSGISQSQLSAFLKRDDRRDIGQDDVCRIAWAFAAGIDAVTPREPRWETRGVGRSRIDVLTNGLLQLAGLSPQTRYEDVIWRSKFGSTTEDRKQPTFRSQLRVGWFPSEPVTGDSFHGLARDITDAVCRLLGKPNYEPVSVEYDQLKPMLRDRRIDLIAPLLVKLPHRLAWFAFSNDVPGLDVQFDAMLRADAALEILNEEGRRVAASGELPTRKHLDFSRVQFCVGEHDYAAPLAEIIFGPDVRPEVLVTARVKRLQLLERILAGHDEEIVDPGRVPVVFTDYPSCRYLQTKLGDSILSITSVVKLPELKTFTLPQSLAVHPREPKLAAAINDALKVLEQSSFFTGLIEEYPEVLKNLRRS